MLRFRRSPSQPPQAETAWRGAAAIAEWRELNPDVAFDVAGADLTGANLSNANLAGANLSDASLDGATFSEANLKECRLENSSLRGANLSGADGLLPSQLAGADLTGATLPPSISVDRLEETAKLGDTADHARMIFMWMIGGCAFVWLMLVSTTQLQHLTNDGVVTLPLFEVDAPSSLFFIAGPFLLIAIYYYLHVYLQRLWEVLASLPAVFPDGEPLDRKTHGWMLMGLVRWRRKRMRGLPSMFIPQTVLSMMLAWALVPLTVYAVWQRCAIRHSWDESIIQVVACACAVHVALGSFASAVGSFSQTTNQWWVWGRFAVSFAVLYGLQGVMQQTFEGQRNWEWFNATIDHYHPTDRTPKWGRSKRELANRYFNQSRFANRDFDGSRDPGFTDDDMKGIDKLSQDWQEAYAEFGGPLLHNSNLAGARVIASDLSSADLSNSQWQNAKLLEADFTQANLTGANFRNAKMIDPVLLGVQARGANFSDAIAEGLIALKGDFTAARLIRFSTTGHPADFRGATFTDAKLHEAMLPAARLQGAVLRGADLSAAILCHADLSRADLTGANLSGADLRGADLLDAIFTNANLSGAVFGEVTLRYTQRASQSFSTSLYNTNLRDANLLGCRGLTPEMLGNAKIDAQTQLDSQLRHALPKPPEQRMVTEQEQWPKLGLRLEEIH